MENAAEDRNMAQNKSTAFFRSRPREGGMELLLPGREKSQRIRRAVEVENNHQGSCVWILLMKFAGPHWLLLEEAPT